MTLKIELSEEQLQLIINALEMNFRIMMGQGSIVADLLAQCPDKTKFDNERSWDRAFERYLISRDFASSLMNCCAETLFYDERLPKDAHRLSDMWSALRHTQYSLQSNKSEWDVRSSKPFQMGDLDMIKVEVLEN